MSNIKVLAGESREVKFKVDIEGTVTPVTEIRFTIYVGESRIGFTGSYNFGIVTFKLKELERVISPGVYDYFLEVYIANQCFVPFKGKIELAKPVDVKISPVEDTIVESVTIKSTLVEKSMAVENVSSKEAEETHETKILDFGETKEEVIKSEKQSSKKKGKTAYIIRL